MKKAQDICRLAAIIAICVIFRVYVRVLPNVQILTPMVVYYAIKRKLCEANIISTLVLIISAFFISLDFWIILQILSYFVVIIFAYTFNKFANKNSYYISLIMFLSGFVYGFFITILQSLLLTGLNNFCVLYLSSLPFDLYHGLGNLFIYFFIIRNIKNYII